MHPTLQAFADRYRHAFPDLVITATPDGEDLRLEWQEGPETPCYAVTAFSRPGDPLCFEYSGGAVHVDCDPLDALVAVLSRERDLSDNPGPLIAAPGTFGALVLERRLLTPPIRPNSPDRLN